MIFHILKEWATELQCCLVFGQWDMPSSYGTVQCTACVVTTKHHKLLHPWTKALINVFNMNYHKLLMWCFYPIWKPHLLPWNLLTLFLCLMLNLSSRSYEHLASQTFCQWLNEKETKENNIQDVWISVHQATFDNIMAADYCNIYVNLETKVTTEEKDKFIEKHK